MTLFSNMSKSQSSPNLPYEGSLSGNVVLNLTVLSRPNDNEDLIGILKLLLDKQMAMNSGTLCYYKYSYTIDIYSSLLLLDTSLILIYNVNLLIYRTKSHLLIDWSLITCYC